MNRVQKMVKENPETFWCAEIEGKVVSFCGCHKLDENKAVLTSYVTDKEFRGRGIGRKVFGKVIRATGSECDFQKDTFLLVLASSVTTRRQY